jgi:dTDP-4-dehydrorhamnose reductase
MRALILGDRGMLGHDLVTSAPADVLLTLASSERDAFDMTRPDALRVLIDRTNPDVVVNAAAYTAVDRAEDEAAKAWALNGNAVDTLAKLCATRGTCVVHFSTDYVFSGRSTSPYREEDPAEPTGAYARSKLAGEHALTSSGAAFLLIRTQWLFGNHGRSFPSTMVDRAESRAPTRVVNDQFGRPTYTVDLARWTWNLIDRRERGIVHAANDGEASWFDVARVIFERAGAADCLEPCTTTDYPTRAKRPAYSVLDISKLKSLIGPVPTWQDALSRFLRARNDASAPT